MYIEYEIKDSDGDWLTGILAIEKIESIMIGVNRNTLKIETVSDKLIFTMKEDKKTADIVYSMLKKALLGESSEVEGLGFVRFIGEKTKNDTAYKAVVNCC